MSVSSDRWTCPRCQRTTVVSGTDKDTAAALAAVRERHDDGHNAGRHNLDTPNTVSARAGARARRAASRAADRRRAKERT